MSERTVQIVEDEAALAKEGAARILSAAEAAIAERRRFTLALAGGSTPRAVYALLAEKQAAWDRWIVFWSDERCVPPDSPDSNYGMARAALLSQLKAAPIAFRMHGEADPAWAAKIYEAAVRANVPPADAGGLPAFDLLLLGLGDDGHTASLFPHTAPLGERERLVLSNVAPKPPVQRLTFTPPLINAARAVLFLVSGAAKAAALAAVLAEEGDDHALPARLVRPAEGALTWLVDRAAARQLKGYT